MAPARSSLLRETPAVHPPPVPAQGRRENETAEQTAKHTRPDDVQGAGVAVAVRFHHFAADDGSQKSIGLGP